jgi:hypothetical protein
MTKLCKLLVVFVGMMFIADVAVADTWTNTTGNKDWFTDANWADGTEPGSLDDAVVDLAGASRSEIGGAQAIARDVLAGDHGTGEIAIISGGSLLARKLLAGTNAGANGTISMAGTSVDLDEDVLVGLSPGATGTFSHSAGEIFARKVIVGVNRNVANGAGTGTYNLSGTGVIVLDEDLLVGLKGQGTFLQTGGEVDANNLIAGVDPPDTGVATGGNGTYEIRGGNIDVLDVLVGLNPGATGTFTQSGGDMLARKIIVGVNRNAANGTATGTFNLSGNSTIDLTEDFLVGLKGTGSFLQTGGDVLARKIVVGVDKPDVGVTTGGTGSYEIRGGTIDVLEQVGISFGAGTTATFTQSGGSVLATKMLLGDQGPDVARSLPASHGTANISGGTIDLIEELFVGNGNDSKGTLNLSGGTIIARKVLLGDNRKGSGTVTLSGTGKLELDEHLFITGDGTSNFTMNGGIIDANGAIVVGAHNKAVMNINSGQILAGSFLLSDSPTGEADVTMTGGTMDLTGSVVFGWGDPNQPDGGVRAKFTLDGPSAVINASNLRSRSEAGPMGGEAFEFELRQGTLNLRGSLADFAGTLPAFGLFDMHGGKLTLDGDKIAHVQSRITSGDLVANGAAMSMLSDFSIMFDGTETIVMLAGTVPGVLGDYNGNGVVDAADYVVWRKNPASLPNEGASPGVVDQADYNFWRSRFGATSGSASALGSAAVPEPHALLLACFGLSMLMGLRRRIS